MIFKVFTTLRTLTGFKKFPSILPPSPKFFFTTSQIPQEQKPQKKPSYQKKKIFSNSPSQEPQQPHSIELTNLLRHYRNRMDKTQNKLNEVCHHCKKIADFYKKKNHNEFVQQKNQIISILETIQSINFNSLELKQYFNLLDFIRICGGIESVTYDSSFRMAKDKVFTLFQQFQKKIDVSGVVQLSILYCKMAPVYHPQTFTVSGLLHDRLAQEMSEKKKIDLSTMQLYVILRSMGKREFLSFPDKKIMEMLLIQLKQRKITDLLIPIAVALKDLNVEINLSDHRFYSVSNSIQAQALAITQEGLLPLQNLEYLQTISQSDNKYFKEIFTHLTKSLIKQFNNKEEKASFLKFKKFVSFVKQLPNEYCFGKEERKIVIGYCERMYEGTADEAVRKEMDYQLLQLIRIQFFGEDIGLIDSLFHEKGVTFIWSFPVEYSFKNIQFTKFPPSILQQSIKPPPFRLDINTIKLWISLCIQSNLHPTNNALIQSYHQSLQAITNHTWQLEDLGTLVKLSVFYPKLVAQFHNRFSGMYLEGLIPTKEEMSGERETKKGQKSKILTFWQYLLIQQHCPHYLLSKIPPYAIFVACFRQSKIKNTQLHPKGALLLSIYHKLLSQKIKFSDHDSIKIIELLILYSNKVNTANQQILQLYWLCVMQLIDQYSSIKKTNIGYVHFLFSKLINLTNPKIKHSLFYKNYLSKLIRLLQSSTIPSSFSYLRTSIIRKGIRHNSIEDVHLSHIEITHFNQQEQRAIYALYDKYEPKEEIDSEDILLLVRMRKGHGRLLEHFQKVCGLIQKSNLNELGRYLTHYSFSSINKDNQKILKKICSEFIIKINPSFTGDQSINLDLMPILKNINQLHIKNPSLYKDIMISICNYLTVNPSSLLLIDHSQVLDLLHEYNITNQPYEQSLWDYCKSIKSKGSTIIDLMLRLRQKTSLNFSKQDYEYAYRIALTNPQKFIQLLVYQQDHFDNIADRVREIADNIERPIPSSLNLMYLQQKYNLIIAKSKRAESRANFAISKFIKSMQQNGIKLKWQFQTGQPIYRITQRTILFFTQQLHQTDSILRNKIMKVLYPQQEIIQLPSNSNTKDIIYALSLLNIVEKEIFSKDIIERIEIDLQNANS